MQFEHWYRSGATLPVVASLTRKAEALREAEIARLFQRCPELDERQRMLVTGLSMRIISKLLHPAISSIRSGDADQLPEALVRAQLIDQIFALTPTDVAGYDERRKHRDGFDKPIIVRSRRPSTDICSSLKRRGHGIVSFSFVQRDGTAGSCVRGE